MKFGKRLAAEAARRWRDNYYDYKITKRAIQDDIAAHGVYCPPSVWLLLDVLLGLLPVTNRRHGAAKLLDALVHSDPQGGHFEAAILHELQKISSFYSAKEAELEVLF